jgi:hypothetical protein
MQGCDEGIEGVQAAIIIVAAKWMSFIQMSKVY